MRFIKDFIRRKENEIIGKSNEAVNIISNDWENFLKRDTYLIYDEKNNFLEFIKNQNEEIKIPWYFFWNNKLKINIKENFEKLDSYKNTIESYNEKFVIEKKEEYHHLFRNGDLILDDNQQRAIIVDDKHNLVIAGAGSGKTEVLITRIAYLTKRKSDRVNPHKILAIAFQNKAATEIKERLKKRYDLDIEIRTFHSFGKKIIEDFYRDKIESAPTLKPECLEDWRYTKYIQELFNREIGVNKDLQNEVINFMKRYGDEEIFKEEEDFEEKEEFFNYQRNLTYTALDGTKVKSEAEREILNFFLMNKLNGKKIKIIYECPADWMKYTNENGEEIIPKPDFYFPEFDIYLEHWALGKNGKVPDWFNGENPTEEYIYFMNLKKEKFKLNQKILIETSYADYQNGNLIEKLSSKFMEILKLKEPNTIFEFRALSYGELVGAVWDSAKFVNQIPFNISKFIIISKTYRLYPENIEKRLQNEKWSAKQYYFSKIAIRIYEIYQEELHKNNQIDFSDMINLSVDLLKENKELYENKYDHILIDEYQDISTQRFEMIKELMNKNSSAKLFCVGDDWQSIMGFAGSNLDFFINFDKYFSHPAKTDLTNNYRSIKSIVDTGTHIIKYNKNNQIDKKIVSSKNEVRPILVFVSKYKKEYFNQYYEQTVKHCLDVIKEYHTTQNYAYSEFMILMRITNKKKLKEYLYEYARNIGIPISEQENNFNSVRLMSVHKSKGLQAKVVIVLNVDKDLYGFPCELESPEIFSPAIKNNDGLREQEERRLFYVAITRAKEQVIMYTQKNSESEFIKEIKSFIKEEELPL